MSWVPLVDLVLFCFVTCVLWVFRISELPVSNDKPVSVESDDTCFGISGRSRARRTLTRQQQRSRKAEQKSNVREVVGCILLLQPPSLLPFSMTSKIRGRVWFTAYTIIRTPYCCTTAVENRRRRGGGRTEKQQRER